MKAKYRLITKKLKKEENADDEMYYCSKCAINLLQQGFKVEEINKMNKKAKVYGQSRIQELKKI